MKLYHPDRRAARGDGGSAKSKGKGKAADDDHEFKAIVAAYELLSDPKRRETYLRTGFGWGGSSRAGFGGGGGSASPWSQSTAEYHFRRGRPMSSHTGRYSGTYDHWAWHAASGHYNGWSDPYNPHFRADEATGGGSSGGAASGMASNSAAAGWDGQGTFGRNGAVFLALMSLTLFMTPLSAWYAVPTAPPGVDPFAPGSDGKLQSEVDAETGGGSAWIPRVYDKRHQDAAANLHKYVQASVPCVLGSAHVSSLRTERGWRHESWGKKSATLSSRSSASLLPLTPLTRFPASDDECSRSGENRRSSGRRKWRRSSAASRVPVTSSLCLHPRPLRALRNSMQAAYSHDGRMVWQHW